MIGFLLFFSAVLIFFGLALVLGGILGQVRGGVGGGLFLLVLGILGLIEARKEVRTAKKVEGAMERKGLTGKGRSWTGEIEGRRYSLRLDYIYDISSAADVARVADIGIEGKSTAKKSELVLRMKRGFLSSKSSVKGPLGERCEDELSDIFRCIYSLTTNIDDEGPIGKAFGRWFSKRIERRIQKSSPSPSEPVDMGRLREQVKKWEEKWGREKVLDLKGFDDGRVWLRIKDWPMADEKLSELLKALVRLSNRLNPF